MKKWIAKLCLGDSCRQFFGLAGYYLPGDNNRQAEAAVQEELRGVWIASVYNIDFPSKQGFLQRR